MNVIEFETILEHGVVTVPQEYIQEWEGRAVRIILMETSESNTTLGRLSQIKIEAPPDFSENWEQYIDSISDAPNT